MESHPPLVHARHDLVVVEETAFASCRATFLDLTPKPFVVVHRTRQEGSKGLSTDVTAVVNPTISFPGLVWANANG